MIVLIWPDFIMIVLIWPDFIMSVLFWFDMTFCSGGNGSVLAAAAGLLQRGWDRAEVSAARSRISIRDEQLPLRSDFRAHPVGKNHRDKKHRGHKHTDQNIEIRNIEIKNIEIKT